MKIIINEKGYMIRIPGYKNIRTPCKLQVNEHNINNLLTYMKSSGITKYEIKVEPENVIIDNQLKASVIKAKSFNNNDNNISIKSSDVNTNIELKKLSKKIDMFIDKIIDSNNTNKKDKVYTEKSKFENNKQKIHIEELCDNNDEDEECFIPTIDLSGFDINNSGSDDTIKYKDKDNNISSNAKSLSSLRRKK